MNLLRITEKISHLRFRGGGEVKPKSPPPGYGTDVSIILIIETCVSDRIEIASLFIPFFVFSKFTAGGKRVQ